MKLNKKSLLFLAIAIFAILGISLGMVQSRQSQERDQLEQDISLAQSRLNKIKNAAESLSSRHKDMENRLVQAMTPLTTVKTGLVQLIETIEVDDALFDIAETCGVEIMGIASPGPADKKLKGVPCSVLPLRVQIEGDVTDLIDFVLKWTEEFHTGVVVSVGINVPRPPEEAGAVEGAEEVVVEEQKPSASINLLIYTYRGD